MEFLSDGVQLRGSLIRTQIPLMESFESKKGAMLWRWNGETLLSEKLLCKSHSLSYYPAIIPSLSNYSANRAIHVDFLNPNFEFESCCSKLRALVFLKGEMKFGRESPGPLLTNVHYWSLTISL